MLTLTNAIHVQVALQNQTISFGSYGDHTVGDAPFALTAAATSTLPVTFVSTTTGVCTVSPATPSPTMVTIVAAGTCTISADQGGNGTYNPAPQVLASFTVNPASGGGAVTRLAGADRYETAVEISKALNPDPGAGIDTAYIATGANFPDALGGGPLAASKHGPILLVPGTSIPAVVEG